VVTKDVRSPAGLPNQNFSLYLDVVRLLAALLVLLYHSNWRTLITENVPMGGYGHSAVIVFFVLSGFVIAYVTDQKEKTPNQYAVNRLARIYSVAIPVLLLTPLLDLAGEAMNPDFYVDKTTHDLWYVRIISSALFLNEVWFVSIMSFSNVPYWSLCYEVWYYVLFAAFVFLKGKTRVVVIALLCLLLGPKILLLMPLWLAGVWLYHAKAAVISHLWVAVALWSASITAFVLFHHIDVQYQIANWLREVVCEWLYKKLTFSKYFLSDYLLAPIIVINFMAFRRISADLPELSKGWVNAIRYASSFTFILYLSHQPLMQFFGALVSGDPDDVSTYFLVIGLVFVSVFFLGFITEHRKRDWKALFVALFNKVARLRLRKAEASA
jgi:peptidoglycan/LPS O-acetylase OafA/YrhL